MKLTQLLSVQALVSSVQYTTHVSSFSLTGTQSLNPNLYRQNIFPVSRNDPTVAFAHPHAETASDSVAEEKKSFIDTELRGAAMKLHTRMQSPKEGEAVEKPQPPEPYTPTRVDYLNFLVDSQHVYKAFEETTVSITTLSDFCDTGLDRVKPLEIDIEFMMKEYDITRPCVGKAGEDYADLIRNIAAKGEENSPEFMCHYYNHYFAHTAGGLMIGKKISALLLDKKKLEFYKYDGNVNKIKGDIKKDIEKLAASWTKEQRQQCVDATAAAFMGGGSINSNLGGRGRSQ